MKANMEANYQASVDFCTPEVGAALRECWALVGDAGYNQVTAIGMTHAFRDSELLAEVKPELPEPEILKNFEAMSANYNVDPFKSTAHP